MSVSAGTPGKHRCARHGVSYGALEQCGRCVEDPGPRPQDVKPALPKPPKGCLSSVAREAWYTKLANDALADAARVDSDADERDFHTEANISAHRSIAIKAMRAAGELGVARETDAITEARRREQDEGAH